jgi:type I restriction enzyme S subunit
MSEWRPVSLGELTELVTKGTTPPAIGEGFTDQGINYIKSDAVGYEGQINKSLFAHISPEMHDKLKRSQLKEDDILFSMAGAFLGKSGLVAADMLPANTNQALAIIRLKKEVTTPRFIYYFLRQKSTVEIVNNMSGQSAQPNINFQEIKSIELVLPPLPEQKAIASVLSSLDDKIDLLHRQNKTLEAMAETLFRQWFVEEAQGDWEEGTIADLIEFNPIRKLAKGIVAPYLEMAALSTAMFSPEGWYDREFTSGTKFVNGDTLLARITPCLENGKSAYITFLDENEVAWGSTEYIVMRPKGELHSFFAYTLVRNRDFRDYAEGCMEGSSGRQRVNVDHLKNYSIKIPSPEVMDDFNSFADPTVHKLHANAGQIHVLEKLRDTLHPKLMSGEVRMEI